MNDQLMPAAAPSSAMIRLTSAVASTSFDRRKPERVEDRCAEAHPAAFEIGGDGRRDRRSGDKLIDVLDLRVGVLPEDRSQSAGLN